MRYLWISLFLIISIYGKCQQSETLKLYVEHVQSLGAEEYYKPVYMFKDSPAYIKYNPITLIPGGMMFIYQKFISPQIFATCLYEESCSKFSIHLIQEYGFFKGASLSADRLSRCTRLSAEDISPIRIDPETHKVTDHVHWYKN